MSRAAHRAFFSHQQSGLTVVARPIILAVAAMFRDQEAFNTGSSVPVDLYMAAEPAEAEYVTFCLPPLSQGTRFDSALCNPANQNDLLVVRRVVE